MSVAEDTMLAIHVESDHITDGCASLAQNMLDILDNGRYVNCSVMKLPGTITVWKDEHRTARKRAMRAERLGYRFDIVNRHEYADDIWAINLSMPERQGRPMSDGYHDRPSETPLPAYACSRHGIHTYGVLSSSGRLVAYLWMYRAGELALVSSILGHADFLDDGVMYLLFQGAVEQEIANGQGAIVYNVHSSGQDGLRWFKERLGLTERRVAWCR